LDAMLGYQIVEGPVTFKAFAGVNWQNHDLKRTSLLTSGGMAPAVAFPSGDPFNPVRGDEVGFKGQLEVWAALGDAFNISAIGSYSTAFDSYWARGRVGYTLMSPVTIGPEVIVLGNERFDQVRVGGFVGLNLDIVNLSFNLGHADDDNNGNSIYGGASLSKRF
ncbi:MAG: cellulose biosynthesis protein BcsS, partial [Rhizobiales bacterium]|nr:cellulose biosynthesis protein BcsS [Hyphomicrobiales bacterium]